MKRKIGEVLLIGQILTQSFIRGDGRNLKEEKYREAIPDKERNSTKDKGKSQQEFRSR